MQISSARLDAVRSSPVRSLESSDVGNNTSPYTTQFPSRGERVSKRENCIYVRERERKKLVQIPSYLAVTRVFQPKCVRRAHGARNFQEQGCNFPKLPPFCPNDGMSIRCHNLFLPPNPLSPAALSLLHATPVTPLNPQPTPTHPRSPSFSPPKHGGPVTLPPDL